MPRYPRIAIVDDEAIIRDTLSALLESKAYAVTCFSNAEDALRAFKSDQAPDLLLLDVMLPDANGIELLPTLKKMSPKTEIIVITAFGDVNQSVVAMQAGASDYLLKPFNVDEILLRIEKALEGRKLSSQVDNLCTTLQADWNAQYIVGNNPIVQRLYEKADIAAQSSSSTVLIRGETGSGKEAVARRIHLMGRRSKQPFVEVNATALSTELLESELFGHEAGSFTGASHQKKGLFEVADGGTLFLDEIGDMDPAIQAKLLRSLEDKSIRRVGGIKNIPVDVRLVAATNTHLEEAVAKGNFREDLFYRLNVVPLTLPPLRERPEDVTALSLLFLQRFALEFQREVESISQEALEVLQTYSWPGNIRELRNLIERTVLLECKGRVLELKHLQAASSRFRGLAGPDGSMAPQHIGDTISLEEVERQHIAGVLRASDGNKNRAAKILGIDRSTLYNKLKKYQDT